MGMADSFLVCDEMVITAIAVRKFWSYHRTDKKSPRAWKGVLLRVSVRVGCTGTQEHQKNLPYSETNPQGNCQQASCLVAVLSWTANIH